MNDKIKIIMRNLIIIICCLIWGSVYFLILGYSSITDVKFIPFLLIILLLVLLIGRKDYKQIFITGICVMFVTQIFCSYLLMVDYATWDPGHVYRNTISFVTTGELLDPNYFARYPNNLSVLYLLIVFYKIIFTLFGNTSIYWGVLLNIFAIDIGVFLSVEVAKYIIHDDAYIVGIIGITFAPFYLWTPIVYTDTLSFPIIMGIILLLFKISNGLKSDDFKNKKIFIIFAKFYLLGMLFYCGYLFKGSIIILMIAAMFYLFFKFNLKEFFSITIGILAGALTISMLWSGIFKGLLISNESFDKEEFPFTHWIMMGTHDKGDYNTTDVRFTVSFDTYDNKLKATSEVIIDWAKEEGLIGITKQMYRKAIRFGWNYGTYYAERYLGDAGDMPRMRNILHEFILTNGKYHNIFRSFTQGYYLILFGMAVASYFITLFKDKKNYEMLFLELSLAGCCMFFMIWETHPRLMLHFSLIMLLLAAYTLRQIKEGIFYFLKKRSLIKNCSNTEEVAKKQE